MFRSIQAAALEQNRIVDATPQDQNVRTLVSSGRAMDDIRVAVVHPDAMTTCAPDKVGEIWVSGPSITHGYWNRSAETERACRAYLKDKGDGPFLRTGDLGFVQDGELFVTGRLKDLIIISGRKLYPHDIELTAEQSHPAIRPGCCAAFAVDGADEEQLVVVAEVEPGYQPGIASAPNRQMGARAHGRKALDVEATVRTIRRAVAEQHDARVRTVVLVRAGRIPMTTSGKVQRHACKASFLDGTLQIFCET